MRKIVCLLACAWVSFFLPVAGLSAEPVVQIMNARFGVFENQKDAKITFTPSVEIPLKEGSRYGWAIEVRTRKPRLMVREESVIGEFKGSASAEKLSSDNQTLTLFSPKTLQVGTRLMTPENGWLYGERIVTAADTKGAHHLLVYVDNVLAGEFAYEFVE